MLTLDHRTSDPYPITLCYKHWKLEIRRVMSSEIQEVWSLLNWTTGGRFCTRIGSRYPSLIVFICWTITSCTALRSTALIRTEITIIVSHIKYSQMWRQHDLKDRFKVRSSNRTETWWLDQEAEQPPVLTADEHKLSKTQGYLRAHYHSRGRHQFAEAH